MSYFYAAGSLRVHVFSAARLQHLSTREHELSELFASLAGNVAHDDSTKVLLVGTHKDGDEKPGSGPADVGMLSNLVLERLNSSNQRYRPTAPPFLALALNLTPKQADSLLHRLAALLPYSLRPNPSAVTLTLTRRAASTSIPVPLALTLTLTLTLTTGWRRPSCTMRRVVSSASKTSVGTSATRQYAAPHSTT